MTGTGPSLGCERRSSLSPRLRDSSALGFEDRFHVHDFPQLEYICLLNSMMGEGGVSWQDQLQDDLEL